MRRADPKVAGAVEQQGGNGRRRQQRQIRMDIQDAPSSGYNSPAPVASHAVLSAPRRSRQARRQCRDGDDAVIGSASPLRAEKSVPSVSSASGDDVARQVDVGGVDLKLVVLEAQQAAASADPHHVVVERADVVAGQPYLWSS